MDASQSSRHVVMCNTYQPSFENPSQTSTEVHGLNVEMEFDEHA